MSPNIIVCEGEIGKVNEEGSRETIVMLPMLQERAVPIYRKNMDVEIVL